MNNLVIFFLITIIIQNLFIMVLIDRVERSIK